jgi:ribonuclease HII
MILMQEMEGLYSFENERMCELENLAVSKGYKFVGGIDEAGRGALAGPVVAACVILNGRNIPSGIVDSKSLSVSKRESLYWKIRKTAHCVGIGVVTPRIIDRINILKATELAMKKSITSMYVKPDFLLIDAVKLPGISIHSLSPTKGEQKSVSIAAASIIAKVHRDGIMMSLSKKYPLYGFSLHKGYGTALHKKHLFEYGPSEVHRYSYKPVSEVCDLWRLKNLKYRGQ